MNYHRVIGPNGEILSATPVAEAERWRPVGDVLALFSPTEQVAIEASGNPAVLIARNRLFARVDPVDLLSLEFSQILDVMVSSGLLTESRKAAIIAGEVP